MGALRGDVVKAAPVEAARGSDLSCAAGGQAAGAVEVGVQHEGARGGARGHAEEGDGCAHVDYDEVIAPNPTAISLNFNVNNGEERTEKKILCKNPSC